MAINFGLAQPNGGYDYLETLRSLGQQQALQQQTQMRGYEFDRQRQIDAARPQIQQLAASGDIAGAQQQAFSIGDYDAVKVIGGLDAQRREQLANQMGAIGRIAVGLKKTQNLDERRRGLAAIAPMLIQQGFSPEAIQNADLSDQGLENYIAAAASTSDVLKSYYANQEDYTLAPGSRRYNGGNLVAENPAAPKYVTTPAGAVSTLVSGGGGDPASTGGDLFSRVLSAESGGRQFAANGQPLTSSAGAVGIAQVMPRTAPEAAQLAGVAWDEQRYRTDPAYNAQIGRAYFEKQLQDFGDPAKAAAAYNAGPGRVQQAVLRYGDAWLDHLPNETKQYVGRVVGGPPSQIVGQPRSPGGGGGGQDKPPSGFRWKGDGTLEPIPGGPADKTKTGTTALKPVPTSALTAYQGNVTSIRQIDEVLSLLDPRNNSPAGQRAKKAIGPGTGMLGDTFTQLNDPEGTEARAMIGRIGGIIIKDISGAAVSASEDNRLARWVPLPTDTPQAARAKLQNLRNAINNTQQAFDDTYNEDNGYKRLQVRNNPSRQPVSSRPQQRGAIGVGQSTTVGAFKVTRVK
jgi:soluble lytic murein transglycosylase-like protein